jgi:hypothetical protein
MLAPTCQRALGLTAGLHLFSPTLCKAVKALDTARMREKSSHRSSQKAHSKASSPCRPIGVSADGKHRRTDFPGGPGVTLVDVTSIPRRKLEAAGCELLRSMRA